MLLNSSVRFLLESTWVEVSLSRFLSVFFSFRLLSLSSFPRPGDKLGLDVAYEVDIGAGADALLPFADTVTSGGLSRDLGRLIFSFDFSSFGSEELFSRLITNFGIDSRADLL